MSDADPAAAAVLVVGDANPDLILQGDVVPRFGQAEQLLTGAAFVIGGSAAITAHGLARLGRPVSLVAAVGRDTRGDDLLAQLGAAGVGLEHVVRRDDAPTGLTVVLSPNLSPGLENADRAILTLPGAIPSLTAAEVLAAVDATGARHLHVSSLYLQPGLAEVLPALLAEVRAAGLSTSLDTNDDPGGTWLGVADLLPNLDLLLPNRAEVLALAALPGDGDPLAAATSLAARGPTVVVKDGASGVVAVRAGYPPTAVRAPERVVLDTTGAGDSFNAAFLDAWLAALPLTDCLHRAALAGSLAVTALGGTAGQPSAHDLTVLLDRSSPRS